MVTWPRRTVSRLALVVCMGLAAPGTGATAVAQAPAFTGEDGGCANAGNNAEILGLAALRASFLCLINVQRDASALPAVIGDVRLRRSADAYSRDMVVRQFFGHRSPPPGAGTLPVRVKRGGYLKRARRWSIGEALAYSTVDVTSLDLFTALMNSPSHRAIILGSRFRRVGVGLRRGVPNGADAGLTVTLHLGVVSVRR